VVGEKTKGLSREKTGGALRCSILNSSGQVLFRGKRRGNNRKRPEKEGNKKPTFGASSSAKSTWTSAQGPSARNTAEEEIPRPLRLKSLPRSVPTGTRSTSRRGEKVGPRIKQGELPSGGRGKGRCTKRKTQKVETKSRPGEPSTSPSRQSSLTKKREFGRKLGRESLTQRQLNFTTTFALMGYPGAAKENYTREGQGPLSKETEREDEKKIQIKSSDGAALTTSQLANRGQEKI